MVWHSADRQRFEFILSRDSGDVRPEFGFQVARDDGAAFFCREYAMGEDAVIGV